MTAQQKILIVDDDKAATEQLAQYLSEELYDTKTAYDGETALDALSEFGPDLVLLDLVLPGIDGFQVCREIRRFSGVPIIIVSAKSDIFDKMLGLELGADDYLVKPFDNRELGARIKAVLRRYRPLGMALRPLPAAAATSGKYVEYPDLAISLTNYSVTYRGESIEMPPKELELLYFLASSPNQVFTREQLLDQLWGYEYMGDTRTVDVHIKRIREKINDHEKWAITTVWGIGYKFEVKK